MKNFNYYLNKVITEELMDGYAQYQSNKLMIRRIESLEEYNEILSRADEPRGVLTNGNFYLANNDSYQVVHSDILEFLSKKNIIDVYGDFYEDGNYDVNSDKFITVQVINKIVYIGESHSYNFYKKINDNTTDEYKYGLEHFKVLDKLNIPYKKEKI